MDRDVVIKFENVSKKFSKSLKNSMVYGVKDIARNMLRLSSRSEKLRPNEFWAVNDVSFEVKRGEAFGLIGHNGCGKTTILKMLNGIFWPDKGKIAIKGRMGALIAVGAGFHPMFTGRENIYINGAILGMNKREINKKFDAIVDFADIGDFLDTPVKNYSSGMFVRLGFAISVHCEPDILLVDEVLAVGDRNFQIKCYQKMHELKKKDDIAIVFVSHNEYIMREYTQKCIVLTQGKMQFYGLTEDAISFYINETNGKKEMPVHIDESIFDNGIIKKVNFRDSLENRINKIQTGERVIIDFEYEVVKEIRNPIFGISFYNSAGLYAGLWNSYENVQLSNIKGKGKVRVIVDPFDLPIDNYRCAVVVCEEEESNVIEWKDLQEKLVVERPKNTRGLLKLRQKWEG